MMLSSNITGCGNDDNDGPTSGDVISRESKEKLVEIGQNLINPGKC